MKLYMRIFSIFVLITTLINLIFSSTSTATSTLQMQAQALASMKIGSTFGIKNSSTTTKTLENPLRLFKLRQEKQLLARVKFMWISSQNPNPNHELNTFNYKVLDINKDNIVVYQVDQNLRKITAKDVNSSKYLMTIKPGDLDLSCNSYMYICTYKEIIREYKKKLRGVNFDLPQQIEKSISKALALNQCLLITNGPFKTLRTVGFLCLDTVEDAVFYQNLISQKILVKANEFYQGQILMVNEVRRSVI